MSIGAINDSRAPAFANLIQQVDSAKKSTGAGFLAEFKAALDAVNQSELNSEQKIRSYEIGDPGTSLNEVMVDLQKASVSLKFGAQVRNKLVNAYHEIMNMSV